MDRNDNKVFPVAMLPALMEEGRIAGYNRQLDPSLYNEMLPDGWCVVSYALVHEHIAGQLAAPHMRLLFVAPGRDDDCPVISGLQIDVSLEQYDRFPTYGAIMQGRST